MGQIKNADQTPISLTGQQIQLSMQLIKLFTYTPAVMRISNVQSCGQYLQIAKKLLLPGLKN